MSAGNTITIGGAAGEAGHEDGNYQRSRFNYPAGLHMHGEQGEIIVADSMNHCVRAISEEGLVRTVAGEPGILGFTDGNPHSGSQFSCPHDVAVDRQGSIIVVDTDNHAIRKIDKDGNVTTLAGSGSAGHADGQGSAAVFNSPKGITMDASREYCIVCDTGNHCLRRVSPTGLVVTFSGKAGQCGFIDGEGQEAMFNHPMGISVNEESIDDSQYLVADAANNRIRVVTLQGRVSTLVGNDDMGYNEGVGAGAMFHGPAGVAWAPMGGFVVADCWNHRIRYVSDTRSSRGAPTYAPTSGANTAVEDDDGNSTVVQLLRKECGRLLQRDDSLSGIARTFETKLREHYDARVATIEKQRDEMEESIKNRTDEFEREISEKRYQCEVECRAMADGQKARIEAVMDTLEKLGPDEIAAAADARNMRLKAQIESLQMQLDQATQGYNPPLNQLEKSNQQQDPSTSAQKAWPEVVTDANFIDGLLTFNNDEPVRDPSQSPFDPSNPKMDSAAKLEQLRVQKQIRDLEDAKQIAIREEDFIKADELKEDLRKLRKKGHTTSPRAIVTVTHLKVKDSFVKAFAASWQEPPRTRLLQDTVDESVFIMYEAHPKREDADSLIGTPDNVKWGEIATWLAEPTKTHIFTAVHMG